MNIRNATDRDLIDVFMLFSREYRETRASDAGVTFKFADILLKFILILKQPEFGVLMVAEEDGRIVGYIYGPYHKGLNGNDDIIAWNAVGWYVRNEYLAGDIMTRLLQAAEETVIKAGIASHIVLTTPVEIKVEGYVAISTNSIKMIREG